MARAAVAAGADGILVEVHDHPEKALSDGPQSIYPHQFASMMDELGQIAPVVSRGLPRGIHVQAAAE
jgi:3-deoxy-7-phosphoheptulonate synthase